MKTSKDLILKLFKNGKEFHKYLKEKYEEDWRYDFDNDQISFEKWAVYYTAIQKEYGDIYGRLIYALMECAYKEDLAEERIIKALRAMGVEVEE